MKKLYLFIILFIFLLSSYSLVFAADSNSKLKETITNGFNWVLGVSALLAGISFAVGAVQYAISHANGKERMFGSVLGLVLLFGAYIIMQTINPKITNLQLQTLPAGPGIYYVKGGEKAPVPSQEPDTTDVVKAGYNQIKYDCLNKEDSPYLLVTAYARPNYKDMKGGDHSEFTLWIPCGKQFPIIKGVSLKLSFAAHGVYFYSKPGCKGEISEVKTSSQSLTEETFVPKSFYIWQNYDDEDDIGVIVHANRDLKFGGICSKPALRGPSFKDDPCVNIESGVTPAAVDIFNMPQNKSALGSGVNFYSEENGWNSLEAAGVYKVTNERITNNIGGIQELSSLEMKYDYSLTNQDSKYQEQNKTFKDKRGSIQINGNYLVAIYSRAASSTKYWCQTFYETVGNLDQKSAVDPNFKNDVKNSRMFVNIYESKPQ